MKKISKILAVLLSVVIFISIVPITASAATYTGKCGTNLTWTLNTSTGTLTISGTGAMYDYVFETCGPVAPGWYSYAPNIKKVVINNGVTTIGDCAFWNCTNISSVTIPDSVITIGYSVFNDTAYYNNSSNWENNVLYIGKHLIEAKDTLSGSYTIKTGTKVISNYAFYYCDSLKSVTIPDSVTNIGGWAFFSCESLTNVTIPKSVTTIGEAAFAYCDSLTSITIPDSVTTISYRAFDYCDSLTDVYYSGTRAQWNNISIGDYNDDLYNATIHYT